MPREPRTKRASFAKLIKAHRSFNYKGFPVLVYKFELAKDSTLEEIVNYFHRSVQVTHGATYYDNFYQYNIESKSSKYGWLKTKDWMSYADFGNFSKVDAQYDHVRNRAEDRSEDYSGQLFNKTRLVEILSYDPTP